ncbi:MAG: hypothetical protein K2J75_06155, partial [Clostridia bacterium]|nr:hypothetical protein [Clostridia bacterium]
NLGIPNKDIKITRTDNTEFVRINIAKDCEIGLGLDFAFGDSASNPPRPLANGSAYKPISAINFTAAGELTLNEAISVDITLSEGSDPIKLEIPKGTYTIALAADLDPTQLIGIKFNANKTSEILSLVETIATRVINTISIKIESKENPNLKLDASVKDGNVNLSDLSLIGALGSALPPIKNMSISNVINNVIKPLLPEDEEEPEVGSGDASGEASGNVSGDASGSTPSGNTGNKVDWDALAALVKNLTLIANEGKISVDVQNHTVNQNLKYKTEVKVDEETGESGEVVVVDENGNPVVDKNYGDTTINVKAEATKNGITIDASLLNIILNQTEERKANVSAKVEVNSNGITITAKSAAKLSDAAAEIDFGSGIKIKIDLVLKLTEFKYGNCA